MGITEFNTVDFIFNKTFRKWVFEPDEASENFWKNIMNSYPEKEKEILQAKRILLAYKLNSHSLDFSDSRGIWKKIVKGIHQEGNREDNGKMENGMKEPTLPQYGHKQRHLFSQWQAVAVILCIVFALAFLVNSFLAGFHHEVEDIPIVFQEHRTPKGVKSTFELPDGSVVKMNSGSLLRYQKGFEGEERKLFLEGEAYFEVKKDVQKPFSVISMEEIQITALGTSFMVQAYPAEEMAVSLISGKISVDMGRETVILSNGEGLRIETDLKKFTKENIQKDRVMSWTEKTILFDKTPIVEAIRVLENWYGIEVNLLNQAPVGLLLTGRFTNETLENVLEGLKYTSKIQYQFKADTVDISFKK